MSAGLDRAHVRRAFGRAASSYSAHAALQDEVASRLRERLDRDDAFEPARVLDSIKTAHGITDATASCHTAEVGNYVIEGHVPADLVQKLVSEHPSDVVGLTVPGMVSGSPGMEGGTPEHYTVLAMMRDGSTKPYAQR